jgi:2-phospho-L-lactate guanylyltransferase
MASLVCGVVPIKSFNSAKTRLAGKLDELQRACMARTSAHRVLQSITSCSQVGMRLAVVEDDETAEFARRHYFEVLLRPELWGQSAAVAAGFDAAIQRGAGTVFTISADVPLTRPSDVEELLCDAGPVLVMVSDREGKGTNALRLTPARDFRLHFGPDSLRQHIREAELIDLRVRVLKNIRLRIDLDTPADIDALETSGPEGRRVLIEAGQLRHDLMKQERESLA